MSLRRIDQDLARQSGFALIYTVAITVVLVMLAGVIVGNILNNLRGARMSSQQSQLTSDAEEGLRMAESELYQNVDQMVFAIWSAVATADAASDSFWAARYSMPDDNPNPQEVFPVRQAELLANARNWPPFCDWGYYLTRFGGYNFSPLGWYTYQDPPTNTTTIVDIDPGIPQQSPGIPAAGQPQFDENDPCLTKGWFYVPRDTTTPDYYYYGIKYDHPQQAVPCPGNGKTVTVYSFPGVVPGTPPTGAQSVNYATTFNGKSVTVPVNVVPDSYWYQNRFNICALNPAPPTTPNPIPRFANWPNASWEYGDGTCNYNQTASYPGRLPSYTPPNTILGDPPTAGYEDNPQRSIWDTPIYKKIYTLGNARHVAVYCRMDLRDYFPPYCYPNCTPAQISGGNAWFYTGPNYHNNSLRFWLWALPEGRVDSAGGTTLIYRPGQMTSKYVYISTGGAQLAELATSSFSQPHNPAYQTNDTTNWELDDHHYPATLLSSSGQLQAGTTINGQEFRADGNLGFRWDSYPTASIGGYASPIASERFVFLYEVFQNFASPGASDTNFLWTYWPQTSVSANGKIDRSGWYTKRLLMTNFASNGTSNWNEPSASLLPALPALNYEASFSAVVDAGGTFSIPPKGDPNDPLYNASGVPVMWTGPVASFSYYTSGPPVYYLRQGLAFSTASGSTR